MGDNTVSKITAIRYWERRRVVYNLALLPPAIFGYLIKDSMNWVGDLHATNYAHLLVLFSLSAIGANICYTFAYALEFFFAPADPSSRWVRLGRAAIFVSGVLFSMLLALMGGVNIADMEWNLRHGNVWW